MRSDHHEVHLSSRTGWLRAAVLGANDGIISTASLMLGMASAGGDSRAVMTAGLAGLVAGAMSMAAGEYVSVSSQADTENADLAIEKRELASDPDFELRELTQIYVGRGVQPHLAREVARQLSAHDALGAHARDELGITETHRARPVQAAVASAAAFSSGALGPLLLMLAAPPASAEAMVTAGSLALLGVLGAVAARAGGAAIARPTARVVFWGALAMGVTAVLGKLLGVVV